MEDLNDLQDKFKNHILTEVLNTPDIKVFDFKKPDNNNLYQRWIIDRGTLIVQYDCWDAIYRWNNSNISLQFLAKCDLGYFSSKCVADKDGSKQTVFDSEYASNYLKEIAADRIYEKYYTELVEIKDWDKLDVAKKIEHVKPIILLYLDIDEYEYDSLFYFENAYETYHFLNNSEYEILFGIDGWEYASNIEPKTIVPKFHIAALREAYNRYPDAF